MKETLKNIKLGQIIGIYHFEDSCFTVGKILKISSKYLFLLSYNINFKEDGIKVFLIDSIKRIILKSDYMRNLEKEQRKVFNIRAKDLFQELIENKVKISIDLADGSVEESYLTEKGEDYFNLQILNDNENKFLIFIDNEDFFETKVGIITDLEDNKIKMKEIDKYGNFHKNSEIYFDEIQLLAVKNYKFLEGNHEEKF